MKRTVRVITDVEVEVDETKFTQEFFDEFSRYIFPIDDVSGHMEHLGSLHAGGIAHEDMFIEGYGQAEEFGIKFNKTVVEAEVLDVTK